MAYINGIVSTYLPSSFEFGRVTLKGEGIDRLRLFSTHSFLRLQN